MRNNPPKQSVEPSSAAAKEWAKSKFEQGKQSVFSRLAKLIFHRGFFISLALLLQILVLAMPVIWFSRTISVVYFYIVYVVITLAAVLHVISSRCQAEYKMAWVVPILTLPVFGGLMYLLYGGNRLSARSKRKMRDQEAAIKRYMGKASEETLAALDALGGDAKTQSAYLESACFSPPHSHTETTYFPLGDSMFRQMKLELERAEKYIFLEYFIIQPGKMWGEILEILERKARAGVDVRVMYDDLGCLYTLPTGYDATLEKMGIRCRVFNRYRPVVTLRLNNRDHRKIMVVDGNVAFTGGINLADEYINEKVRFGHWKDSGIMLRGDAVWNFTVMFLSGWDNVAGIREDFASFRPSLPVGDVVRDGVVQPYDDSPLDDRPVGANVYHNLIAKATRYVYLTTPYLIIDDDMTAALCVAAQSGVDVRIITPHIPDKKLVFQATRAHYPLLLESGVRIFEYTPGFIHAKNFAVDDRYGTVGTVNMDYRSLYLHFECGVWMAGSSAISGVREDFLATQAMSEEITLEKAKQMSRNKRLMQALLRAFSHLL